MRAIKAASVILLIQVAVAVTYSVDIPDDVLFQAPGNNSRPTGLLSTTSSDADSVAEILVVLDKKLSDKFDQDMDRINDYIRVYFWDINMRFKTLPSVRISFKVVGVIKIATFAEQAFIEKTRVNGKTNLGKMLGAFVDWFGEKASILPKSDVALLMSGMDHLEIDGCCGLAWGGSACNGNRAAVVVDKGDWQSPATIAHELGHVLGAPHDNEVGCGDEYIMGGSTKKPYFLSPCSDKSISEFVSRTGCLRQTDSPNALALDPYYSDGPAPTLLEQCRMKYGPSATISDNDTKNCTEMRCEVNGNFGKVEPVDNTVCMINQPGDGRCFRGFCRPIGKQIWNVGSGECMQASTHFEADNRDMKMSNCSSLLLWNPIDRFTITDSRLGKFLATPYNNRDASERGDICITGVRGHDVFTRYCIDWQNWQHHQLMHIEYDQYLIKSIEFGLCMKQNGTRVTLNDCVVNDPAMRWKFI